MDTSPPIPPRPRQGPGVALRIRSYPGTLPVPALRGEAAPGARGRAPQAAVRADCVVLRPRSAGLVLIGAGCELQRGLNCFWCQVMPWFLQCAIFS